MGWGWRRGVHFFKSKQIQHVVGATTRKGSTHHQRPERRIRRSLYLVSSQIRISGTSFQHVYEEQQRRVWGCMLLCVYVLWGVCVCACHRVCVRCLLPVNCICLSPTSVYHLFSQSYDLSLQASVQNAAKLHTAVWMCAWRGGGR